jgi:hypothetical protein
MEKLVSERLHVSGLVIQLVRMERDTFAIVTVNDKTGIWWPTLEGGTPEQAKQYVDGILRDSKHDCSQLGCPDWMDHSPTAPSPKSTD